MRWSTLNDRLSAALESAPHILVQSVAIRNKDKS